MKSSIFTSKDKPKFTLTPKMIVFPLIFLAIVGVVGYFALQYRKYAEPPFLQVEEPQDNSVVVNQNVLVKGQVEIGTTLTVNNQEVNTVDNLGFFEIYITLPIEGTNKITVVAENSIGKQSIEERTVVYEPEPEEQLAVTIRSISEDPITITISRDNNTAEEKELEAGGEFTIGAISIVTITLEDPEEIEVYANNQAIELNEISGEAELSTTTIKYENEQIVTQ